ncbi:MET10 [[Candida] subhashii]|uniref:assimilatory sulfite reductase (NADPH) n=1 Tax=[Candida] subhashii TaxID=561895 RepID=A0A8J5UKS6_9ASCO|nr:MET10 [[Candida] subhashii]KAG7662266.1 MET10 [[Candida] subhashii]
MSPHALVEEPSVPSSSSVSVNELDAGNIAIIKANPFGTAVDPNLIKGSVYTSASTIINQTVYSIASKIFSYETIGDDNLLDSHIQLWTQTYQRTNSFGIVPFFHKFQVRSGASNAILGYFKKNGTNGQPVSAFVGANALNYMRSSLSGQVANNLPLAFNVSAIDFDQETNSLVSNYGSPLSVARALNYSVFTPVDANDGLELQHLAILNHVFASFVGKPSLYLFDGPEFAKTFTKFHDLLSVEKLGHLYQDLLLKLSSVSVGNLDQAIDAVFVALNDLTGKTYSQFEYTGAANPETVFVVYGSHETSQVSSVVGTTTGLIKVRVPLPFNQDKFLASIPSSTKKLVVLTPNTSDVSLKADITASVYLSGRYHTLSIDEFNYPLDFNWTPITITKILTQFDPTLNIDQLLPPPAAATSINGSALTANSSPEGKYLFWGKDNSILVPTADRLALSLSLDNTKTISIRNKFDNATAGGLFQSQIVSTSSSEIQSVDAADVVIIDDLSILDNYDIVATTKPGAHILYINPKKPITSIEEDVIGKLSIDFKKAVARNENKLSLIDFSILETLDELNSSTKGFSGDFLVQLGFWRAALPELDGFIVNKLLQANGNSFELLGTVLDNFIKIVDENQGIKEIPVSPEWVDLVEEAPSKEEQQPEESDDIEVDEEEEVELPFFPIETSFFPNPRTASTTNSTEEISTTSIKSLATKIAFPEAFGISQELRPDLPVKNFVVKVQESKRLTPAEYSRNIFHIEFDTTGTGLTYDIGEALGIHGRNNSEAVEAFLDFYGVDGDSLVEITNKDDATLLEIRSARQALSETVDFLGKPPKRFYESLSEFATDEKEQQALRKLASAEGAAELKQRQEVEFDTYFDILEEFQSARPKFEELIKIIAPLKRREYSIASSQRIHENAVHLLIVVVDWIDPRGRLRYGHCSKYLSDLKIGDELVVSVKPSVMKLPPLSTQPIVMSGLGTGLAPFKAFVEEKIWQQQQGMAIGDIYLYLGSRHKKEEYLYGELWEAYKDAGILTHIGAAFSRDQKQKIYIQDKIRESIEELTDAIVTKNGSFYLCGPTWPVPDITACLEDIVANGAKKTGVEIKDVAKVVEDMKEDGRYILEVY